MPVRGATPSTTWLSQLNTPCESRHIRASVCRVLLRDRSHLCEQKITWVQQTTAIISLQHSRIQKFVKENATGKYIFEWNECYSTRYGCLRARCIVCTCVFSYTCAYTVASIFRNAYLHRRSIKQWWRVEYFDTMCWYSYPIRMLSHFSHFQLCVIILYLHPCICITVCFHLSYTLFLSIASRISASPMIFHEMSHWKG